MQTDPQDITWDQPSTAPQQGGGVVITDPTIASGEARADAGEVRAERQIGLAEQSGARDAASSERAEQREEREQERFELEKEGGGLTEGQSKSLGFYQRSRRANTEIARLNLSPEGYLGLMGQDVSPSILAGLSSDERNAARAAIEDFIASTLRVESGAAIAEDEFDRQYRIFFPTPGAGPKEIEAKKRARELAIRGFQATSSPIGAQMAEKNLRDLGYIDENGEPITTAVTDGTPSPKAPSFSEPDPTVSGEGETFLTPEDIKLRDGGNTLLDSGASLAEVNAFVEENGGTAPFRSEADLAKFRKEGGRFTVTPTGRRNAAKQLIGSAADSEGGAYVIGAANALLSGGMDELAGVLGMDAAQVEASKQMLREKYPASSFAGEVTGQAVNMATGTKALSLAGVAAPKAAVAAEVIGGAAYGAGESNDNRLLGASLGGAGAFVGQKIANKLFPNAGPQADEAIEVAAEKAGVPKGALEGVLAEVANPATGREIIEAGADAGIPIKTTDIIPPKTFIGQQAQRAGERVPFLGTGGGRAAQQEARVDAVSDFLLEYGDTTGDDLSRQMFDDLTAKRQAVVTKNTSAKREVIDRLSGSGEVDPKQFLEAMYEEAADLTLRNTDESRAVLDTLTKYRDQVVGRDLAGLEAWRKDTLSKAFQGVDVNPAVKDLGNQVLKRLYDPLRKDMGDFIKEVGKPKDYTKWRVANANLSKEAGELGKASLRNILKSGDATPEVVERLLFSKKPSDVKAIYKGLTEKGRSSARRAIVNRVAKDMGAVDGNISPERFVSALRKQSGQLGVFFKGDEAKQVKGLVTALNATRRASGAKTATQTGQEAVPYIAASGLLDVFQTGGLATGAAGTGGLSARAYESASVRNLLVKLGEAQSAAQQDNLMNQLGKVLNKITPPATANISADAGTDDNTTSTLEVQQ